MNRKYLLLILTMVLFVACGNKEQATTEESEGDLPEVKIAQVMNEDIPQTETYSATVESDIVNNISPNVNYRIEKIYCEVGDNVKKGQLLVQLDASSLRQTKLQLDNQQIEFNRTKSLYDVGGASKAEYDNAQMQLDVLETQYKQLVENTQLLSPISGVVTARNYDNGDMYNGTPILTIEKTNPVKLIINVSEEHYKDVHLGQSVDVTLDAYEGEEFTGKVTIVNPSIDPATHTFPVEITIDNSSQKVRPGMFARVIIDFGIVNRVLVPDESLVKQIGAGDRYVYVYHNDSQIVSYNKVELGRHIGTNYEIISGVEPSDYVVIAGQSRLANGVKVRLSEDKDNLFMPKSKSENYNKNDSISESASDKQEQPAE